MTVTDAYVLFDQNADSWSGTRRFMGVFASVEDCDAYLASKHLHDYEGYTEEQKHWWRKMERDCYGERMVKNWTCFAVEKWELGY